MYGRPKPFERTQSLSIAVAEVKARARDLAVLRELTIVFESH